MVCLIEANDYVVMMISIIIPIYNAEKYLRCCIESIIAQTFTDFELLLIDDGSKDNSGAICDEYAAKDARIRVFHKENGGVSSARNLGLDNAKGEWITFIDSDDWVKQDYLYSMISQPDADLIMSSFDIIENVEEWDNNIECKIYTKNEIKNFIDIYIYTANLCSPWCKLFRSSLINQLRFNSNISFAEDTIFVFEYLCNVQCVRTVENWGYQYRRGLGESLSIKLLSLEQYRYIIREYTRCFKEMEHVFDYNGICARVCHNSNQFRKCFYVLRERNKSFYSRYKDFVNLLQDENIDEIIRYNNPQFKGRRRKIFDFFALNRCYFLLFVYVLYYKGFIY